MAFELAGVGRQNQLCAGQHQEAGGFRLLPIIADHGAHLDRAGGGFESGHRERVATADQTLAVPVAGVDLGVGEQALTFAVEKGKRIAGKAAKILQISKGDGHIELARKVTKGM